MKVQKLDHVHIYVNDLGKAVRFFSEILGTKFSEVIEKPGWDFKLAMDPLGVELVQPTSPEGGTARAMQKRGEGIFMVSFKVENLDEAVAELEAKGMRVISRIQDGKLREVQFHPRDAHGVMIELAEYEEEHGVIHASRRK
jgi:methylmalonyl-CoA/ethylmalonyl-CoA epimerase